MPTAPLEIINRHNNLIIKDKILNMVQIKDEFSAKTGSHPIKEVDKKYPIDGPKG